MFTDGKEVSRFQLSNECARANVLTSEADVG